MMRLCVARLCFTRCRSKDSERRGLSLVTAAARRDRLGWRLENEDGEAQGYNSFVFQLHEISCGCTVNP